MKREYQRLLYNRLSKLDCSDPEHRVRGKPERWKLQDPPAHVAQRILRRLSRLCKLVTPRVNAAYFSTLWNRWATARRFQLRGTPACACVLGCPGLAEDSIEHYARCPTVRTVAAKFLRIEAGGDYDLQRFLITEKGDPDDATLVCRAVLVYATNMATNHFRHRRTGRPDTRQAIDALEQYCRNAVRGHVSSERIIDGRWQDAATNSRGKRHRIVQ